MKIKNKIYSIFKFNLGFMVAMLVLEIFLRLTQISLPSPLMWHKRLGLVYKPNSSITTFNEGFCMTDINKYGYTGTAYPPERAEGNLRIALVGDSYVESHYLFQHCYFGSILEKKLAPLIHRDVEVLNFGMSGINLRRMYIYYKEWVMNFHPDITLFVVGSVDLVEDDRNMGPFCYLEKGALKISFDFAGSKQFKTKSQYEFIRRCSFYPLLRRAYDFYRRGLSADILLGALNPFKPAKREDTLKSPTRENDPFFEINRAIFATLNNINHTRKTRNIIVLKKEVPLYYEKMILGMGLPTIHLGKELQKLEKQGINPYYWKATNRKGHWNHAAHQWIGDFLANYFARSKYVAKLTNKGGKKNEKLPVPL